MSGTLEGKIVFVTGGGGGIGRATSLVMAREGAAVAVSDSDLPLAEETVARLLSVPMFPLLPFVNDSRAPLRLLSVAPVPSRVVPFPSTVIVPKLTMVVPRSVPVLPPVKESVAPV